MSTPPEAMPRPLHQTTAMITGASGGMGAAITRHLAASGARVFVCGRDPARTQTVAAAVDAPYWTGDLSDPHAAVAAVDSAERALGKLDVVVAAAGTRGTTGDLTRPVAGECEAILRDNVVTLSHVLTAALPALSRTPGGTFLALSSLAGLTGYPRFPYYTAAKAGTIGLVRAMAPRARRSGVRARVLCSFFTDTPLITDLMDELTHKDVPVQSPERVAEAVLSCLRSPCWEPVWTITPGRPAQPYQYAQVPEPLAQPPG
ncbi:SDR family NAD(P)-dependent oxidoreductase [Streptomyces cyaneofuscatus]|uniref:SDR family NAD(P)-dependent oxidoreductase n=1 Tax=Streptomyces cyaneofuscatus TaxID=66883 RepID=UPI0036495F93